jgi:hypothetical protein
MMSFRVRVKLTKVKAIPDSVKELDDGLRKATFQIQLDKAVEAINDWEEPPPRPKYLIWTIAAFIITGTVIIILHAPNPQVANPPSKVVTEVVKRPSVKLATLEFLDPNSMVGPPAITTPLPVIKVPFQMGRLIKVSGLINNSISLDFALDSGAVDVSIPLDAYRSLRKLGSIAQSDLRGEKTYVMADGHMSHSQTFVIRSLTIGDATVYNVEAGIGGPLPLLGQSFLLHFKSWSIDYQQSTLVLRRE